MFQRWCDLLFAHWPLPYDQLRALVPRELSLDEHSGSAWLGLTPFRVEGLRPRLLPSLPGLSRFPELNLRTYVRVDDKPGVFFFSLDVGSRLAALAARLSYRVPYFAAKMRVSSQGEEIAYRSRRRTGTHAELVARYHPVGPMFQAQPGSLEHFLVERYALYSLPTRNRLLRADIHHCPWSLRGAEAEIPRNSVAAESGLTLPSVPPLLHFGARQDTLIWPPRPV